MSRTHNLPLSGFFLTNQEITLAGTMEEIRLLAYEILYGDNTDIFPLTVPNDPPFPYDGFVRGIQLVEADGQVHIDFIDNILVISGSVESRKSLASILSKAAGELVEDMTFIKRRVRLASSSDYPFVASTSTPLIINVIGFDSQYSDIARPHTPQVFIDSIYRPGCSNFDSATGML